jgi:hypothetical protein
MALALYLVILGVACAVAVRDWRKGWMALLLCTIIQDPVRKVTPGSPVVISFSIVAIYAAMIFSARRELRANARELSNRFPSLSAAAVLFLAMLGIAALRGLVYFGLTHWKVPLLSLFTYVAPLPAIILGYAYLQDEEKLYKLFRFYAVITSLAMIGTVLEYLRVSWPTLGMVAMPWDQIRHLQGMQIRMLSGFYRAPDVMGWHASVLTSIGIAMTARHGFGRRAWPWMAAATWGFFICMISGRRKAIYFVLAFGVAFLWRYIRRLTASQLFGVVAVALLLAGVVRNLESVEETSVYARGAATTREELVSRLEGGMVGTFQQSGYLGIGLGAATQGTRHLVVGSNVRLGWQEGGLAKLAVEVGLPGVLAAFILVGVLMRKLLLLTRIGDVPGSSQFARAALFGLAVANVSTFMISAQAYTDAALALTTGFMAGCLLATAALDERFAAAQKRRTSPALQPAPA